MPDRRMHLERHLNSEVGFDMNTQELDLSLLYKYFRKRERQTIEGVKNGDLFFTTHEEILQHASKLAMFDCLGSRS